MGPFYSTDSIELAMDTFIVSGTDTARYRVMSESANPMSNRPHIDIKAFQQTGVTWHVFITQPTAPCTPGTSMSSTTMPAT